jgi:hypothetical protein
MCRKTLFLTAAALLLSLSVGCGGPSAAQTEPPASPDPTATPAASAPEPSPEASPEPTPEATPEPTPESTSRPVYQFGVPVEESEPVADDTFFDKAAFLGDSRTEGLQLFSGLKHGTFYWARGMNVFLAGGDEYKAFPVNGEDCTLIGALEQGDFDSIYIMIGVNELGVAVESYEAGLSKLVDRIIAAQPEAVVYLQIMPPLNDEMCRTNDLAYYINNENLQKFNEVIVRVATEKKVALLNTAEVYTGEDGQLPAELANDGCHFAYEAYSLWANYMRNHVIDRELYFYSRENS